MSTDLPTEIYEVMRDLHMHASVHEIAGEIFRKRVMKLPHQMREMARRKATTHELYPNEKTLHREMISLGYEFVVFASSE